MTCLRFAMSLLILAGCTAIARAQHWPQFRGPDSTGTVESPNLPDHWSTTDNVVWKIEVPGRGWSSPIIWGDRLFLTSAISEGDDIEPRKGLYVGGEQWRPDPNPHRWMVFCYDIETGKLLWARMAHRGRPKSPIHIKNSYASETPVTDGQRVYAYFGNLGLFVYDNEGKKLWERRFPPVATKMGWGTASSPVIHEGRIYIVNDNDEDSYLLALDAESGREIWRVARDEKSNWATPFIWKNDLRTEIVTEGSGRIRSYDLGGNLLWELSWEPPGSSGITIATPYASHGLLYVSTGFVMSRHRPIFAIRPGAKGDIAREGGEASREPIAWVQPRAAPYNPSTIVYDGLLYSLLDAGFLACFDAKVGKQVYRKQRLGVSGGFTASPWAYDGKIFCLSEDGETAVIRAGPEYELLSVSSLEEMCMATPAIADGSLFIRTLRHLYRIGRVEADSDE